MKITLNLTHEELCHISASLNNQSINYRDWAFDNIDDKDIFDDYIESSRQCKLLEEKFDAFLLKEE